MKATKASIGRAVDQPEPKLRFYLFLGTDEGQSRALANRLLEGIGATKFAVSGGELKSRPGLLADEAAALSLFGERRLIWIEPAANDIVESVETLLLADAVESPVVAIAGTLSRTSALVKLAESSPLALAFTAYAPEGQEAARMVVDLGRRVGLKVSPSLSERIANSCDNDQAVVLRELEKFALYLGADPHAPKELDRATIEAVGTGHGEEDIMRLADLALLGELAQLAVSISRLSSVGSEAIPALRSLQRRILMLAPARSRIERGEPLDAVMASFGKALFWKDKEAVSKMLGRWTAKDLAVISERAGTLERNIMFNNAPEREALGEELLTIARKAQRAR